MDKELKKLSRIEILELLMSQQDEYEQIMAELELKDQIIDDLKTKVNNVPSISKDEIDNIIAAKTLEIEEKYKAIYEEKAKKHEIHCANIIKQEVNKQVAKYKEDTEKQYQEIEEFKKEAVKSAQKTIEEAKKEAAEIVTQKQETPDYEKEFEDIFNKIIGI